MKPLLSTSGRDDPQLRAELVSKLRPMLTPPDTMAPPRWVTANLRNDVSGLVGGAIGLTTGLWLSIELLWVDEQQRGQGFGTTLLQSIEAEAIDRKCKGAYVETGSRAARVFYEHVGYRTKLVREEAGPGLVRYTLQKRFRSQVKDP